MVRETPTDRYADTGFGVADTSPEVNALMWKGLMDLSGEERMEMGSSMFDSAREMILASLPDGLSESERKRALYERTYGETLPQACWDWLRRM